MSYKNYAAINKINKLESELEEYKGNKIVKEEPKETQEESTIMTLDSILSTNEETKTQKIEKEIEYYPRFATITGAQLLEINFYDLGNLVRQYEEVFPNEDKKLA